MHEKALEIRKRKLGDYQPSTAESCNNMGVVWNDRGEHKQAIKVYRETLQIQLKLLGDEDQ